MLPSTFKAYGVVLPPVILNPLPLSLNDNPLYVLFVNVSVPLSVDNVPDVGKEILVLFDTYKVVL